MIDSPVPEMAHSGEHQAQSRSTPEPSERLISWLIVGASFVLAYLVFRVVMLELDVHNLLDELLAMAGQAPRSKS